MLVDLLREAGSLVDVVSNLGSLSDDAVVLAGTVLLVLVVFAVGELIVTVRR